MLMIKSPNFEPGGRVFESPVRKHRLAPEWGLFVFEAREFELCCPKGNVRTEEREARRQAEPRSGDEAAKLPSNLSRRAISRI